MERKRQDRFVQNAEKHRERPEVEPSAWPEPPRTAWLRDSRCPPDHKTLNPQALSGDYHSKWQATWGMSVEESCD